MGKIVKMAQKRIGEKMGAIEISRMNVIIVPRLLDIEVVEREVQEDDKLKAIFDRLLTNPDCIPRYTVPLGKLFCRSRLALSKTSSLIPTILHSFHDSVIGGHSR